MRNSFCCFVANNGFFYSINTDQFKEYKKLDKIDQNPMDDKYLIKHFFKLKNAIYFCSDTGKMFYYNTENKNSLMINVSDYPLIASPVMINGHLYVIDTNSQIFRITID